mgnify:CR=1 FL=1
MKKFLVVGLGNPGIEYARTRHNIGFDLLDAWAAGHSAAFAVARYGDRAQFSIKGRTIVAIKPSTFMNLSGKAVRYWLEEEKVPLEKLVVVVDELALPVGHVRLKLKGSEIESQIEKLALTLDASPWTPKEYQVSHLAGLKVNLDELTKYQSTLVAVIAGYDKLLVTNDPEKLTDPKA